MRGIHNVVNATGAAALAMAVGVEPAHVATRSPNSAGLPDGSTSVASTGRDVRRRLRPPADRDRCGARRGASSGDGWQRVISVFQPNRYNRIAEIWADYANAFVDADIVVLTDIYPSGTTPIPGVTGKLLVNAVAEAHPEQRLVWLPRREDLVRFVSTEVRQGDVCISMGCGDIATFPTEVLDARRTS